MSVAGTEALCEQVGYQFVDRQLLALALTHRSHGRPNNERLEFLGDSVLNFVIADELYRRFPQAREGQLSRLRAKLVKGEALADVARDLSLGELLYLGQGELASGGQRRDSILADALEALLGAVYLDGGWSAGRECVLRLYRSRLDALTLDDVHKDAKTLLQEWLQARKRALPGYQVESVGGAAHMQHFKVACRVEGLSRPVSGEGSSRRLAEQRAAALALATLQGGSSDE